MGQTFTFIRASIDQGSPPKSKFATNQIPDLTGRVVIVTGECLIIYGIMIFLRQVALHYLRPIGGNVGVGKETVKVYFTDVSYYLRQSAQYLVDRLCSNIMPRFTWVPVREARQKPPSKSSKNPRARKQFSWSWTLAASHLSVMLPTNF